MPETLEFIGGTAVACSDGPCGTLGRLIIDPEGRSVSHLSVEPSGLTASAGHLVPIENVQLIDETIHLSLTSNEYGALPANEETHVAMAPIYAMRPGGLGFANLILHCIPEGEIEVNSEENVTATDGRAGHLRGLTVDPVSHGIERVLLTSGHLAHKVHVSIPVEHLAKIDDEGMHFNLTKQEIHDYQ